MNTHKLGEGEAITGILNRVYEHGQLGYMLEIGYPDKIPTGTLGLEEAKRALKKLVLEALPAEDTTPDVDELEKADRMGYNSAIRDARANLKVLMGE